MHGYTMFFFFVPTSFHFPLNASLVVTALNNIESAPVHNTHPPTLQKKWIGPRTLNTALSALSLHLFS